MADLSAIRFTVAWSRTSSSVKLRYAVFNPTPTVLGMFNRIPVVQPNQPPRLPREGSYVELNGSRLSIRKVILQPPPGIRAAEVTLPYVMTVEPNARFEEEFELPLPVLVHQPFVQALISRDHPGADVLPVAPAQASSAVFELGVFAVAAPIRVMPLGVDYPNIFRLAGPVPAPAAVKILSAETTLTPPLPVLQYRAVAHGQAKD